MKYLNNKDLLKQIHISKMSYSWYKNKDTFFRHNYLYSWNKILIDITIQVKQKLNITITF